MLRDLPSVEQRGVPGRKVVAVVLVELSTTNVFWKHEKVTGC